MNTEEAISEAASIVEGLKDEIDSWKSNMEGTNLENTEKFSNLEEALDALETLTDELQGIDATSVGDVYVETAKTPAKASRATRLGVAQSMIEDLTSQLESLIDAAQEVVDTLQGLDWDVNFPTMYS